MDIEHLQHYARNALDSYIFGNDGDFSDGVALDAFFGILGADDLDNDEKIYCLNELAELIRKLS